jgi:hypothetical protein
MTVPQDWLETWGEAIDPANLSGSMAVRFRDFLLSQAEGLAIITGARRSGPAAENELLIIQARTNRPQRPAYPILREEPLGIFFTTDESYAPSVLSLRADFPETPHQNWVPEGVPFSLCVDDRPWQEARPLYTPAELLHRIIKWFERAGRGGLHDPRQPLDPFFMAKGCHLVIPRNAFEGGAVRELEGFAPDLENQLVVILRESRPQQPRQGSFTVIALSFEPRAMGRMRRAPTNLASLLHELAERDINLAEVLAARFTAWSAAGHHVNFNTRLGLLLRMPIMGPDGKPTDTSDDVAFVTDVTVGEVGVALGFLGRSPDPRGAPYARLIQPEPRDDNALAGMKLVSAAAHLEFDQQRALELAAGPKTTLHRVVQIGAGAIGSLAAETLARQGLGLHWTIIDPDYLLPHNLARHELTTPEVGTSKAVSLARRLAQLRTDLRADAIIADVLKPGDRGNDVSMALQSADLVIDAAASVPVARWLSDQPTQARRVSIFFNPAGTAVVMLMESQDRTVDLRMLEAGYYGEVLRVSALENHLSQSIDAVPYAGACRAVTNRIPAARAQVLAGLASAAVMQAVNEPNSSLRVWTLSPDGSVSVHQGNMGRVRTNSVLDWTITLPHDLEAKILAMRTGGLPAETGGVLFGVVDLVARRIDLIEAWSAPADSKASETEFIRGTKGLRQGVEAAIARTLDQVRYVGEWHSHPRRASTNPSGKDLLQLGWLATTLSMDGCPGIMLIAGDTGVRLYLGSMTDDEGLRL